jgi:single-strand DNA-binding protein
MSFNKILIIGNIGSDPDLRFTPQGVPVCTFTVATNERKRDKGGEMQDYTTWFKCTFWRQQAEFIKKNFAKGSPIYVEGKLRIDEWTDREGKNRYTLEVQGTDVHFVGGKTDTEQPKAKAAVATYDEDGQIPF